MTTNVDKVKQSRTFQIIRQECWTLHLMLRLMCYANKHFCGKGELQMGFSNMYSSYLLLKLYRLVLHLYVSFEFSNNVNWNCGFSLKYKKCRFSMNHDFLFPKIYLLKVIINTNAPQGTTRNGIFPVSIPWFKKTLRHSGWHGGFSLSARE